MEVEWSRSSSLKPMPSISHWKMNLVAISSSRLFFLAEGKKISVSKFLLDCQISPPFTKLSPSREDINAIRIGMLGTEEVLVSVDDVGQVQVFFVNNLERTPISIMNPESTWGIALGSTSYYLAVSSNGHEITLIDTKSRSENEVHHPDVRFLKGHLHNIPAVDISPCGNYLVSASIDETCRLWETSTGKELKAKKISPEWGWGVRFIKKSFIKIVDEKDKYFLTDDSKLLFEVRKEIGISYPSRFFSRIRQIFHGDAEDGEEEEEEGEDEEENDEDGEDENDLEMNDRDNEEDRIEGWEESEVEIAEEESEIEGGIEFEQSSNQSLKEMEEKESLLPEKKKEKKKEKEFPYLIIFTSQHHLFLLDENMQILAKLQDPISIPFSENVLLTGIDRLSLLQFIPEFSLLILSSQGSGRAILIRIIRGQNESKYKLIPEMILPKTKPPHNIPLIGMDCAKKFIKGRLISFELILVYLTGEYFVCEINLNPKTQELEVESLIL